MIRPAEEKDVPKINVLIKNGVREGSLLTRSIIDISYAVEMGRFIVAEKEDRVYACCSLEVYSARLAEIRSLYVYPTDRKNGVAKEMIQLLIDRAKHQNIQEVLAVTDKIPLFEKFGFRNCLEGQQALFLKI